MLLHVVDDILFCMLVFFVTSFVLLVESKEAQQQGLLECSNRVF